MYSRSTSKSESIKIPDHYSGCAFSPNTQASSVPKTPATLPGVARPSPTPPPPIDSKAESGEAPQKQASALSALPLPFGGLGGAFRHGIGFEELLLLGLILLLSQTDADSHLSLMLGLLLFCG